MLQTYVLKYLWFDVVLTVFYLINRMQSAPFGGEVPLQCLQHEELFSLHPKVFGCVAFVRDLSPSLDKLFLQAVSVKPEGHKLHEIISGNSPVKSMSKIGG